MIFSTLVVDAFHYLTNIYTRDYQKYLKTIQSQVQQLIRSPNSIAVFDHL